MNASVYALNSFNEMIHGDSDVFDPSPFSRANVPLAPSFDLAGPSRTPSKKKKASKSGSKPRAPNPPKSGANGPPRPPNAFILYRNKHQPLLVESHRGQGMSSRDFSAMIGAQWQNEDETVKQHFRELSKAKMAEHRALYPEYKYRPVNKPKKKEPEELDESEDYAPTSPVPTTTFRAPARSDSFSSEAESVEVTPPRLKEKRKSSRVVALAIKNEFSAGFRNDSLSVGESPVSAATSSGPIGLASLDIGDSPTLPSSHERAAVLDSGFMVSSPTSSEPPTSFFSESGASSSISSNISSSKDRKLSKRQTNKDFGSRDRKPYSRPSSDSQAETTPPKRRATNSSLTSHVEDRSASMSVSGSDFEFQPELDFKSHGGKSRSASQYRKFLIAQAPKHLNSFSGDSNVSGSSEDNMECDDDNHLIKIKSSASSVASSRASSVCNFLDSLTVHSRASSEYYSSPQPLFMPDNVSVKSDMSSLRSFTANSSKNLTFSEYELAVMDSSFMTIQDLLQLSASQPTNHFPQEQEQQPQSTRSLFFPPSPPLPSHTVAPIASSLPPIMLTDTSPETQTLGDTEETSPVDSSTPVNSVPPSTQQFDYPFAPFTQPQSNINSSSGAGLFTKSKRITSLKLNTLSTSSLSLSAGKKSAGLWLTSAKMLSPMTTDLFGEEMLVRASSTVNAPSSALTPASGGGTTAVAAAAAAAASASGSSGMVGGGGGLMTATTPRASGFGMFGKSVFEYLGGLSPMRPSPSTTWDKQNPFW
ncbi:hypothetical protein HDU79_009169 [Rhizoclosmatium sp. JEL0117]|nr:hypothetical protein HDU79_009169 [Rhizoclosmatium sp. JEL0117]